MSAHTKRKQAEANTAPTSTGKAPIAKPAKQAKTKRSTDTTNAVREYERDVNALREKFERDVATKQEQLKRAVQQLKHVRCACGRKKPNDSPRCTEPNCVEWLDKCTKCNPIEQCHMCQKYFCERCLSSNVNCRCHTFYECKECRAKPESDLWDCPDCKEVKCRDCMQECDECEEWTCSKCIFGKCCGRRRCASCHEDHKCQDSEDERRWRFFD